MSAEADEFKLTGSSARGRGRHRGNVRGVTKRVPDEWCKPIGTENERNVCRKVERQRRRPWTESSTSVEFDEEIIILHAASCEPSDLIVANSLLFRVEKKRTLRAVADLAAEQWIRDENVVD